MKKEKDWPEEESAEETEGCEEETHLVEGGITNPPLQQYLEGVCACVHVCKRLCAYILLHKITSY